MTRTHAINMALVVISIWLALIDHCLVVSSGVGITSPAVFILTLQAAILLLFALLANDALPTLLDILASGPVGRGKLFSIIIVIAFFFMTPMLLSQSLYDARFGVLQAKNHPFIWRDLSVCCANPFARPSDKPQSQ
jgi:hypothetical protein